MEYGNIISLNDDENYDDLSEFAVSQNTLAEDIEDMYSDYGYTSGPGATPPYSSMSASPASSVTGLAFHRGRTRPPNGLLLSHPPTQNSSPLSRNSSPGIRIPQHMRSTSLASASSQDADYRHIPPAQVQAILRENEELRREVANLQGQLTMALNNFQTLASSVGRVETGISGPSAVQQPPLRENTMLPIQQSASLPAVAPFVTRSRSSFPRVAFWYQSEWTEFENTAQVSKSLERRHVAYFEDENGKRLDINFSKRVRRFFLQCLDVLLEHGIFASTWSQYPPSAKNWLYAGAEGEFIELSYCDSHWKSEKLIRTQHQTWHTTKFKGQHNTKRIREEEANKVIKRVKREEGVAELISMHSRAGPSRLPEVQDDLSEDSGPMDVKDNTPPIVPLASVPQKPRVFASVLAKKKATPRSPASPSQSEPASLPQNLSPLPSLPPSPPPPSVDMFSLPPPPTAPAQTLLVLPPPPTGLISSPLLSPSAPSQSLPLATPSQPSPLASPSQPLPSTVLQPLAEIQPASLPADHRPTPVPEEIKRTTGSRQAEPPAPIFSMPLGQAAVVVGGPTPGPAAPDVPTNKSQGSSLKPKGRGGSRSAGSGATRKDSPVHQPSTTQTAKGNFSRIWSIDNPGGLDSDFEKAWKVQKAESAKGKGKA